MEINLGNIGAELFVRTFKGYVKVIAIFTDIDLCNEYLTNNPEMGVIDESDPYIFVANCNDKGVK